MKEQRQSLNSRRIAFNRRCRQVEKAALDCLDPGTDTLKERERRARRKVEKVTDLTIEYLLAIARTDRKLGESVRAQLLPILQAWELELDARTNYLGDLRSKPK